MKKTLLLFTLVAAAFASTFAQNLHLSSDGVKLGDTVTIWVDPLQDALIDYSMAIHNNTNSGMNVQVARQIITPLTDMQFSFCVGAICYGPDTDSCGADVYQYVPENGASDQNEFKVTYYTSQMVGTAIVKYNVYDKDNPADSVNIFVQYAAYPAGIAEEAMMGGTVSEIYPNPASTFVSIDYQLTSKVNSAQVKVFNMLGSTVKETNLQLGSDKVRMDISDLNNGVYFYSVLINGDVYSTKKLVVRK